MSSIPREEAQAIAALAARNPDLWTRLARWTADSPGRYVRLRHTGGLFHCTLRHPTMAGPSDTTGHSAVLEDAVNAALRMEADYAG